MAALPQVLSQSHGGLAVAQIVASGNGQDTEVAGSVAKSSSTYHQVSERNRDGQVQLRARAISAVFGASLDAFPVEGLLERVRDSADE